MVHDDFYLTLGIWGDSPNVWYRDGAFVLGPSPGSDVFLQVESVCGSCGLPITYQMEVDATYGAGAAEPERGFGLILRWAQQDYVPVEEDYVLIAEFGPGQSIDVWRFDAGPEPWLASLDAWEWVGGGRSDALNPGRSSNRVGATATRGQDNTVDIAITVNGTTVLVVPGQPADRGWVGLAALDHSLEVIFDNFDFEAFE